jgi:DNA processing protein
LIRQGAKLIEHAGDIIEEILPHVTMPPGSGNDTPVREAPWAGTIAMDADQQKVMAALSHEPVHIDELVHRCGIDPGPLSAILGELEIKGAIVQEPGKFFIVT